MCNRHFDTVFLGHVPRGTSRIPLLGVLLVVCLCARDDDGIKCDRLDTGSQPHHVPRQFKVVRTRPKLARRQKHQATMLLIVLTLLFSALPPFANPSPFSTRCFTLFPSEVKLRRSILAHHHDKVLGKVVLSQASSNCCLRGELGPLKRARQRLALVCTNAVKHQPCFLDLVGLAGFLSRTLQAKGFCGRRIDQMDTCPLTQVLPSPFTHGLYNSQCAS